MIREAPNLGYLIYVAKHKCITKIYFHLNYNTSFTIEDTKKNDTNPWIKANSGR